MPRGKTKLELIVEAKVRDALRDLDKTEKEVDDLSKSGDKASKSFKSWAAAAKTLIGALAVREVARFALETAKLTAEAQNLRRSLTNLANREGLDTQKLMKDLRRATADTVDEIKLMQAATQAKFLGVDLENLPTLFEFAYRRALDTGQGVDYLVESIVTGIGRKSALILDNLGIQMRDLDREIEQIAKSQGEWDGKVDENLRNLYLQEAAIRIAKRGIEESGEANENAAVQLERINTQWTRFKIAVGAILTGPVADALEFVNESFERLGINIDKILATGTEKELLGVRDSIKEVQEEIDLVNQNIEIHTSGIGKYSAALNKFFGMDKVQNYQDQLVSLQERLNQLRQREAKLEAQLKSERGREPDKGTGAEEIQQEKEIAEAIQNVRLQAALAGAENEFRTRLIQLENWYETEREKFKENEEYQVELKAAYEARKAKIREDILAHNQEVLAQALENEILLEIEAEERSRRIWEQRRDNFRFYAREIGYMFQGPMNQMVQSFLTGTAKAEEVFDQFIDNLMAEIRRFLASQIVNTFLNLLANAIFPGAGAIFGGPIQSRIFGGGRQFGGPMSPGKFYTVGETGPELVYQGRGGGQVFPLPSVSAPSPAMTLPVMQTRIIDRSRQVPIVGNIQVESVAPELNRVRKYYIQINRDINIPDTDRFNQYNRTGKGEFDVK